jgi:Sensors of blue-light using FAD
MQMLHRLIYFSRACEVGTESTGSILRAILEVAIPQNRRVGITGALLSCGGWFLQALEGPYQSVNETYGSICNDRRHEALRIIRASPVSARDFADWSMCGRELSATDSSIVSTLEIKKGFDATLLNEKSSLRLLSVVRDLQMGDRQYTMI